MCWEVKRYRRKVSDVTCSASALQDILEKGDRELGEPRGS
jgi:hypothetical protein